MTNQTRHSGKAMIVQMLLEQEGRVMLCVNATHPNVDVPRRFSLQESLNLILNQKMPHPIDIGPEAITSELRFGGIPHFCTIPYDALWGAYNPDTSHGMFWPEAMPETVRKQMEENAAHQAETSHSETTPPENKTTKGFQPQIIEGDGVKRKKDHKKPQFRVIQ